MALFEIPTNTLQEKIVKALPKNGKENIVYRVLSSDETLADIGVTDDFIWHDGEFIPFSFDAKIYGVFFNIYQQSVAETISELEARVEALESEDRVLFEGSNISLTEEGATIGKTLSIASTIEVTDGTKVHAYLSDMTLDGEAVDDVDGEISLYGLASWDWQGGELYSDVFGNGAYFAFGTKPMNNVAEQVTLGFVNEQEHFDIRTLVIGHIKVEIAESEVK